MVSHHNATDFKWVYKHGWQVRCFHSKMNTNESVNTEQTQTVSNICCRHAKPPITSSSLILRRPSAPLMVEGTSRKWVMHFRCRTCQQLYWFHTQPSFLSQFAARCFNSSFLWLFSFLFFPFFLFPLNFWLQTKNRDQLGNLVKHIQMAI